MAPVPLPKGLTIVSKAEWGGKPPANTVRLKTPVGHVRYVYTQTEACFNLKECSLILQAFQDRFMSRKFDDLPYNFLIGGDGVVYEGRGWDVEGERPTKYKKLKGICVDIAYIGNFDDCIPGPKMSDAAAELVKYGMKCNKIEDTPRIHTLHEFRDE